MLNLPIAWFMALASLALIQSASAADILTKTSQNWSGFYVGANVGAGWDSSGVDYSANDPAAAALFGVGGQPPSARLKGPGVMGGFQAGYNWQVKRSWLVGLEADIDWAGVKADGSSGGVFSGRPFSAEAEERISALGTVRARVGYLPTERLLTYVTGGLAYGRVEHAGNYAQSAAAIGVPNSGGFSFACYTNAQCFSGSQKSWSVGWTAGAGFEFALLHNVTVKAEYLHVSLASNSVSETANALFPAVVGVVPASFTGSFDRTNLDVVRVGMNYRF